MTGSVALAEDEDEEEEDDERDSPAEDEEEVVVDTETTPLDELSLVASPAELELSPVSLELDSPLVDSLNESELSEASSVMRQPEITIPNNKTKVEIHLGCFK